MENKLINLLKENNCIHTSKTINLASGNTSNTYYDIKKASGIPELLQFIISELKHIIPQDSSIVAVSTGGIPYSSILSYEYKSSFAYVRDNKKQYGMNNVVEGCIDFKKTIFIIDDVCTTGKSILKAKNHVIEYAKHKGINHELDIKLVTIVNRGNNNLKLKSILEL